MEEICGSKFWSSELTWNSIFPDLTSCFESTVLVWIPCGFLWLMAGYELFHAFGTTGCIICNSFVNVVHRVLTFLLVILYVIEFCFMIRGEDKTLDYLAYKLRPGIKSLTFGLALTLYWINKQRGIRSSGVMFSFWTLLMFCDFVEFQTVIRHFSKDQNSLHSLMRSMVVFISFPVIVLQFLLGFFSDPGISISTMESRRIIDDAALDLLHITSPELVASFPSRISFHWVTPLIWRGFKKPLEMTDLWDLSIENTSYATITCFNKYWLPAMDKCRSLNKELVVQKVGKGSEDNPGFKDKKETTRKRTASIVPSIFKANLCVILFGGVTRLANDSLAFFQPYFLRLLIEHKMSKEQDWIGYCYAVILFTIAMLQTFILGQHYHYMFQMGMRIRSAVAAAIYQKSLVVSHAAREEFTVGEIVNLMSTDTQKIFDLFVYLHLIWSPPIQIIVALYLLWKVLGSSIFAGMGIMALFVPFNIVIADAVKILQAKRMDFKDERVKLMNEVLSGIKVLKLYAWEPSFERKIREIRYNEIDLLRITSYLNAFSVFLWYTAPFLISVITFTTYVLSDSRNILDAKKAFVSLSLFNLMRAPMSQMPNMMVAGIEGIVSVKRVNKFLNSEEIDPEAVVHEDLTDGKPIIKIDNATFAWGEDSLALQDISLAVETGSLIAVMGFVGSGKTSLLSAMLGEMHKISGTICVNGTVSYVAQQSWIQNSTIRDNIIFGKPFEANRYRQILAACSLVPDLLVLSGGDKTEIGEKGINLSGGQKSRIAIARAAYHDSDAYLFDDPLSAVDAQVGKHIFDHVIGPQGMLSKKTRILVTHGITFLPHMTKIVLMAEGKITGIGTYEELVNSNSNFAEFLSRHLQPGSEKEATNKKIEDKTGVNKSLMEKQSREESFLKLQSSRASWLAKTLGESVTTVDRLIEEEKAETGTVNADCYTYFAESVGWWLTFSAFSFYLLYSACAVCANIWLSHWSSTPPSANGRQDTTQRDIFLMGYGTLGIGQGLSFFVANLAIFLGCLQASKHLHDQVLWNVLRCPMLFFESNPIGRIVNRFARDVEVIDTSFPTNLRSWMTCFFHVVSTLVVISYSTPWFLIVVVPIGVLYFTVERFYVASSRQLKRVDSITRSPIYTQFTETLTGAVTIRAFKKQQKFIAVSERTVNYNQMAYFASLVANRWLAIRLETIGNLIILFSAILAAIPSTDVGSVGLSVTYALNITLTLNWLVRMTSEVESNAVAVERIKEYNEVPQEADWEKPENKPVDSWPDKGGIVFKNFQTQYRPGQNFTIKNITCSIEPGEKVGIVGRTGSGKSSLTLGIFRIIEATEGSIEIDGIDISKIGLHDIRGRVTIIPQDPILFSGTLRFNIDPFLKYSDDELWHAIECAHLKKLVQEFPKGLEQTINEGGDNLSVGQRQLVCLARALLRKTKILIMDEATASLDLDTDDLIQTTVRTEFKDCTVLTIAHRINTIMDYNRVIVLDNGEIREYDSPEVLLHKEKAFSKMVKDAGL